MKFYIYYTMSTGRSIMDSPTASEALAASESVRLAGGTVTKILDDKGVAYTLAELVRITSRAIH